ncbi:MAG: T9SS type A sorting domain-containing protein [Bacteroidetes bacterium]|nr:T9SS type A sorting domain-containing protein [Bacteroidota bacterium]
MKQLTFFFICFVAGLTTNGQNIKIVGIFAKDIVYVPSKDRLYVSTPGVGTNGNSLCAINPHTGAVENCYFVGSEPGVIALSDDENFIYVGLNGSPQVARFNLQTNITDLTFSIGSDPFFGPFYAEEIEVLPGSPHSIAVSRMSLGVSPRHMGVAVFDDGVMRPNTTQVHTGSNSLAFGESPDVLYGYNNETTEFGFRSINVSTNGLNEVAVAANLISGFGPRIEGHGSMVYSNSGSVINVSGIAPLLQGAYDLPVPSYYAAVEPAPDSNVVYFVVGYSQSSISLRTFQKNTFTLLEEKPLNGTSGYIGSLVNWGSGGKLAFNTDEMVVILESCNSLVSGPLSVEPTQAGGCWGSFVVLTAENGYDNYLWSNGMQGQNIAVYDEGDYYYQVADSLGCFSQPSNIATVMFGNTPPTPYIQVNGNLLASSAMQGNQWFLNGNPIPGANGQFYTPTQNGFYSVQTNDNGCVSDISDIVNFTLTASDETSLSPSIIIYPNPAKDYLRFIYDAHRFDVKSIEIYDMLGRSIDLSLHGDEIQLEGMSPGTYFIKIKDTLGNLVAVQKFLKVN